MAQIHIPPLGMVPDRSVPTPVRSATKVPAVSRGLPLQAFAFLVLSLYALTFLRVWAWGPERFSSPLGSGARTPLIQYGAYAGIVALTGLAVWRGSLWRVLDSIKAYAPFLAVGLLSGIAAAGKADFVRPIGFWLVGVAGLVSIAGLLGVRWLYNALAVIALGSLAGTAALCLASPGGNTYPDPRAIGGVSWAGLFWEKNSLGLVAANSVLLALWWRGVPKWLPAVLLGLALLCLVRSGSGGSAAALFGAAGAVTLGWLFLRLPLSPAARCSLFLLTLAAGIIAGSILFPLILEALGRDATLTGRTRIWPAFLERALMKPILGWGPGTFTYPSYATSDLVQQFSGFGTISSPHNVFIAVLGDSGLLGFLAMVLPLLYFTFAVPFRRGGQLGLLSLAVGALIIVHGFVESSVIFGFSINWITLFLVMLLLGEDDDTEEMILARGASGRGVQQTNDGQGR